MVVSFAVLLLAMLCLGFLCEMAVFGQKDLTVELAKRALQPLKTRLL